MKISVDYHLDAIAILRIEGALKHASALMELRQNCRALVDEGICALLIDLSKCPRANMAGLAALVEFAGTSADFHVAYCNMNESINRKLEATGLDGGLHIHKTAPEAFKSNHFKRASLRRTTAVVLCNTPKSNRHSIFNSVPIPMLDILGQPLIQRIKNQLSSYGVQDIVANPGHLGDQIIDHFRRTASAERPLRFANEGARRNGEWIAESLGSAGTLQRIQQRESAFQSDFLVLWGNTLTDLDLQALISSHRKQQADVTIACDPAESHISVMRGQHEALGRWTPGRPIRVDKGKSTKPPLTRGCAYVFSPRVLEMVAIQKQWRVQEDFLPALAAAGAKVREFQTRGALVEITTPYDYARELKSLLSRGTKRDALLVGGEAASLVSDQSIISNKARVSAQSYIGPGAKLGSGVEILGTCVISAGAEISGPSVLENCVVSEGVRIEPGFWAHDMSIHQDRSFNHRFENEDQPPIPSELPAVSDAIAFPMQKSA